MKHSTNEQKQFKTRICFVFVSLKHTQFCYYSFMSSEQQAIGIMEGAFFVPKGDLMNWVNSLLGLEVTRIQQLGTGAVYCQIVDAMFPCKVLMQRVNWSAKNQWEFINNYKILQQSFGKCKIQKHIDIQKLSKSKYQDNLEFIQWMKRYYDLFNKNTNQPYDAVSVRKNAVVDFSFVQFRNPSKRRELEKLQANIKSRAHSRSPYDGIKPKINNRSVTLGKHEVKSKKTEIYLEKLCQIRDILKKSKSKGKSDDPIQKIKQIVQQIEQDLPPIEQQLPISTVKLETVHSQTTIDQVHRKQKNQQTPKIKKGKR